jgi:hypothetical protein
VHERGVVRDDSIPHYATRLLILRRVHLLSARGAEAFIMDDENFVNWSAGVSGVRVNWQSGRVV